MTYGFALLTAGALLMYSGWSNSTIADVMKGLAVRKGGAGDTGFVSLLSAPATGAANAITPGSGGGNNHNERSKRAPKKVPQSIKAASALHGLGTFDGKQVALWIIPYLNYGRAHGWNGHVESGYRSYQDQVETCATGVQPCATPGTSNHEGKVFPKGAVDVTEAEQLSHILERMPGGALLKWAGAADPVHFSFPHNGSY